MQDWASHGAAAAEGAGPAGLPPLPPGVKGGPGGSMRPVKSAAAQLKEALTKIKKLRAAVAGPPEIAPAVQVSAWGLHFLHADWKKQVWDQPAGFGMAVRESYSRATQGASSVQVKRSDRYVVGS